MFKIRMLKYYLLSKLFPKKYAFKIGIDFSNGTDYTCVCDVFYDKNKNITKRLNVTYIEHSINKKNVK